MVWGLNPPKLSDQFRGGKYVPKQLRPISVPLTERATLEMSSSASGKSKSGLAKTMKPSRASSTTPESSLNITAQMSMDEEELAEQARRAVQEEMEKEGMQEDFLLPLVEQRRVVIEVKQAANLPIMDDEAGQTCDPYVMLECCGSEAKTRHLYRTLDPEWKESHVLKLPLPSEADNLKVTVMDWDQSAHDTVGSFELPLGSKTHPFPTVEDKYINHKISMAGVFSTTTFEDWYELTNPEGKVVYGLRRQKTFINLRIQHIHEVRDVRFRPTPEFLAACAKAPALRLRREIRFMTHEIVTQMPAAAQLSSRVIAYMCTVGQLREWKKWDVVQLQNPKPSEDALHLVLSGNQNNI